MRIDCHDCAQYQTHHCDDCLVTALLHPPDDIVEIDEELDRSLDALSGAGLIPVLKFRPRDVPEGDGKAKAG
jgi:hypothetical protein